MAIRILSSENIDGVLTFSTTGTFGDNASITHYTNNFLYIRGGSAGLVVGDNTSATRALFSSSNFITWEINGGAAMHMDSSKRLGIGTTSPDTLLHIYNPDTNWGAYSVITLGTDVEGTNQAQLKYYRGASTSTESFQLSVRGTTALTALYNGNVGIGTNDPDGKVHIFKGSNGATTVGTASDELILENDTDCGLTIRSAADGTGVVSFASPTDHNVGQLYYNHDDDSMVIRTNDAIRTIIGSSGIMYIMGATASTNNSLQLQYNSTAGTAEIYSKSTGGNTTFEFYTSSSGTTTQKFNIGSSGDVKITTNGKFLQGVRNTGGSVIDMIGFGAGTDRLQIKGGTSGGAESIAFFDTAGQMATFYNSNFGIGVTSPSGKLEVAGGNTLGFRLSNLGNQSAYDQVRMTYTGYNSGSPTVTFMPLTTPGSGNAYTTFLFQNTNGINASSNNNANVAIDGTLQVGRSKGLGETTLIMNNYDTSLAGLNQIQNSIRMSGRYWSGSASQLVETRINSVHQESDGNGGSALTFMTQTGGSAVVEQMRIDKVGNVGIGTTSPVYKLDVKGSDTNNAIIARFYSNVGARGDFIIRNGSGTSPTTYIGTGGGSEELSIGSNNTNSIYIDSQQKVGIGTTSPGEKLEVNGNIKAGDTTGKFFTNVYTVTTASFADTFSSSGAGLWEYTIRINPNPAGSGSYVDFYYGKVGVGTGWNGSNVTDYIWYQEDQTAPRSLYPSGGGNKTISWVMVSGGSEVTNVSSGATVTIRVKGFGGNSYNQNISIYLRRLA